MGAFMSMAEKIRILLIKRGNISEAELARRLGLSTPNWYNRMKRDNFTDSDLQKIAAALDCTFKAGFVLNDTGEEI
jgi:transcriptional regulator with XRE-family HTH domain